jgi:hypothetical protein
MLILDFKSNAFKRADKLKDKDMIKNKKWLFQYQFDKVPDPIIKDNDV